MTTEKVLVNFCGITGTDDDDVLAVMLLFIWIRHHMDVASALQFEGHSNNIWSTVVHAVIASTFKISTFSPHTAFNM